MFLSLWPYSKTISFLILDVILMFVQGDGFHPNFIPKPHQKISIHLSFYSGLTTGLNQRDRVPFDCQYLKRKRGKRKAAQALPDRQRGRERVGKRKKESRKKKRTSYTPYGGHYQIVSVINIITDLLARVRFVGY